jgi:FXSXX-COOH protein
MSLTFIEDCPERVMSLHKQELISVIPDLRDLPLERLAELGDSVLAHSIALYRQRLRETGLPLSAFQSKI